MTTTYTYSLNVDFGGDIDVELFRQDINNSAIVPECVAVLNKLDVVNVIFDTGLSAGEQTTLNNLVSTHTPQTGTSTHFSSDKSTSVTLTEWQTDSTLKTRFLAPGDYRVHWSYIFTADDGQSNIRICVDDATVIHLNNSTLPVVKGSIEYERSSWEVVTLTEGYHTITVQIHGKSTAATSIIRTRLFICEA